MSNLFVPVVACLAIAGVLLLVALPRLRGTTLAAPLFWGVAAAAAVGGFEVFLRTATEAGPLGQSAWRYLAATATFCPLMAVLGAKRPQDRGWQWIVLSLWVVLAIPAGQALLVNAGPRVELSGIWKGFVILLLAMTLLNYLPTRFWLATFPFVAGQAVLFSEYLGWLPALDATSRAGIGCLLMLAGVAVAMLQARQARGVRLAEEAGVEQLTEQVQRWLAFRDRWGAFWAARAMARVNQTAELQAWPVRLQMSGFHTADDRDEAVEVSEELVAKIAKTLDALLWRFERPS